MTSEGNKKPDRDCLIVAELFLFLACISASYATLQDLRNPFLSWIVTTYHVIPLAANALIATISGYSLLKLGYSIWVRPAEGEVMYELAENTVVALFFLLFASAIFTETLRYLYLEPTLQAVYAHTIASLIFLTLSVSKKQEQRGGAEGEI